MKKIFVVLLLFPLVLLAQTKTTQETQIVIAVKLTKNEIYALYPLTAIKKNKKGLQGCMGCSYFLGLLSGAYEQKGMQIEPSEGTTITVFKDQEVFTEKKQFPEDDFKIKNEVTLGGSKAIIIANKKGELILKAKNDEE